MCKIHCSFNLPKIPESVYGFIYPLQLLWASLVAQLVKNPPAIQGILVWFLGQEDPLEKE